MRLTTVFSRYCPPNSSWGHPTVMGPARSHSGSHTPTPGAFHCWDQSPLHETPLGSTHTPPMQSHTSFVTSSTLGFPQQTLRCLIPESNLLTAQEHRSSYIWGLQGTWTQNLWALSPHSPSLWKSHPSSWACCDSECLLTLPEPLVPASLAVQRVSNSWSLALGSHHAELLLQLTWQLLFFNTSSVISFWLMTFEGVELSVKYKVAPDSC